MKFARRAATLIATTLVLTMNLNGGKAMALTDHDLIAAEEKFGCSVFKNLCKENKEKNVFVSPASLSMALGMATIGARSRTYTDMRTALSIPNDVNEEALTDALHAALSELKSSDPAVEFDVANAILVSSSIPLKKEYTDLLHAKLDCKAENVDFGSPSAQAMIDKWVSEKTKGKIDKLTLKLNKLTAAVILNALYFKGAWAHKFEEGSTKQGDFHNQSGKVSQVPLMHMTRAFHYLETEQFQAVRMPFGDGTYSAVIFLPKKKGLDDLVGTISGDNFEKWIGQFSTDTVELTLPKFKINYEAELEKTLSALGMSVAFSDGADFSGMASAQPGLKIGQVVHKTALEVDENGATAAAVTAVVMQHRALARRPEPPKVMTVDRPFVFSIYDNKRHGLLFIGSMRNL